MNLFSRFMSDESGVTAIEYGLIAAIVAVGIIAALGNVKTGLQTTFNSVRRQYEHCQQVSSRFKVLCSALGGSPSAPLFKL